MKSEEINMTEGPLAKNIWMYSLPLMCTNVLQVLFNLADVAVAGKFAGTIALGAVGSTSILIALTTGLQLGISAGINAVAALFLGARDTEKVRRTVCTSLLICLVTGLTIMLAGILFANRILTLMGTKDELIAGARIYFMIYMLGSPALSLYNYGNAILSAAGDTGRPLRYLTTAGVINVILNLVFVIGFGLDVVGVAMASVISQYISAILMIRYLLICRKEYGLDIRRMVFDRSIAGRVLAIGIPTAIQYSLFAVANLFIQSAVNSFDHVIVEGNSAAANADNIVYDIMAAFYTACTSFVAQNRGARRLDRIRPIFLYTTFFPALIAIVLGGLLVIFRIPFLKLFTDDAEVIGYGSIRLSIMGCSYFVSAFMDNAAAGARGLGKSVVPTIIVILGTVVYRIVWVFTVFRHFHTLPSLYLVFMTAWIFTAIIGNIYFVWAYRQAMGTGPLTHKF